VRVETVDAQKEKIGAETSECFLGDGADQRKGILAQRASGEDDLDGSACKLGGNIHSIGNDREVLEVAQSPRHSGGGSSGVQDHDLTLFHFGRRGLCDPHFFLTMQFFLFAQRGIFERALTRGQSSAMSAVDETVGVQDFEVLANRNLRGFEMTAKFGDQDPAVAVEQFEDGATTFFVKHWN